jgi:hypothetical protein
VSLICGSYAEREKAVPDTAALHVRAREGASQAAETVRDRVPTRGTPAD